MSPSPLQPSPQQAPLELLSNRSHSCSSTRSEPTTDGQPNPLAPPTVPKGRSGVRLAVGCGFAAWAAATWASMAGVPGAPVGVRRQGPRGGAEGRGKRRRAKLPLPPYRWAVCALAPCPAAHSAPVAPHHPPSVAPPWYKHPRIPSPYSAAPHLPISKSPCPHTHQRVAPLVTRVPLAPQPMLSRSLHTPAPQCAVRQYIRTP